MKISWSFLVAFLLNNYTVMCKTPSSPGQKSVTTTPSSRARATTASNPQKSTPAPASQRQGIQEVYVLDPSERFCKPNQNYPFYQRKSDGAVCCRGTPFHLPTVVPETTGECAISTKTDANGILDSGNLWCAYTCTLKKMGAIDKDGKVVPGVYFPLLADGLTDVFKDNVRKTMTSHLGCFKSFKNSKSACHTPFSFQKCFLDAMYYVCTYGAPKAEDIQKIKKLNLDYEKLEPLCYYNKRKVSPGCCHGKPMPWTAMEILEAPGNETKMNQCLDTMGPQCDATCYLNSVDAVNPEMELDVGIFERKVLRHFPTVKASGWMDYLGPVFLFYDEVLADMGDESSDTPHRVCRFHDRVMELHESKVDQYCSMTPEEIKELIKKQA